MSFNRFVNFNGAAAAVFAVLFSIPASVQASPEQTSNDAANNNQQSSTSSSQRTVQTQLGRNIGGAVKRAVAVRGGGPQRTDFNGRHDLVIGADNDWVSGGGAWGDVSFTRTVTDPLDAQTDAHSVSALVGADVIFQDRYVVGLSGGLSFTDSDTRLEKTAAANGFSDESQESFSGTIAPYAAYIINDNFLYRRFGRCDLRGYGYRNQQSRQYDALFHHRSRSRDDLRVLQRQLPAHHG